MADLHEIILPDGTARRLGNNSVGVRMFAKARVYGDVPETPMFPRSKWPELVAEFSNDFEDPFAPPIHDQDGVGQCNCDCTTAMGEAIRLIQGLPYVQLSAADLYHRINGGADNGSMLEDALEEMMLRGVGTAETCGTLWKRGFKQAGATERKRFVLLEAFWCPTFEHCFSAVCAGFRLNTGIPWYSNYNTDGDGWLPSGRGSSGGHSIMGNKPAMRGNVFGIRHRNSWGTSWGVNGCMVIPENAYRGQVGGWWAARAMTDEGGQVPAEAA